ncbi:MAG TPA: YfiR family protein [Thermoguttaceae bacterium]|nr:YfiR family protein [Thermoguttaceae bacterium]
MRGLVVRAAAAAVVSGLCLPAAAQALRDSIRPTLEYRVKAAYLYNFLLYVTWPEEALDGSNSPLVIGVLGDDPLGTALDEVARHKRAKGRGIVVRRFESWQEDTRCHILFVPRTVSRATLTAVVQRTRGSPVLLVGETPGLATVGAPVNFYLDVDRTIGFEINVDATAERNLRVDARLLKLARIIKGPSQDGGNG